MRRRLVLVDGVNSLIRSFAAHAELRSPSGVPTGACYGVVNRIREACERFDPARVVCAWDGGRSAWRKKIFPGYKDRPPTSEADVFRDCFAQRGIVSELLNYVGVDQVELRGVEADDAIAAGVLAGMFGVYDEFVILSTDKDYYQLIDDRTSVWTVAAKEPVTVTRENFASVEQTKGFGKPCDWHAFKIVTGDGSDMIPSAMPGIGEKRFPPVLETLYKMGYDGDALDFFVGRTEVGVKGDPKIAERIVESWPVLRRNTLLMDLRFAVRMMGDTRPVKLDLGVWNEKAAERLCSRLNFQSALSRWTDWTRSFTKLSEGKRNGVQ